MGSRQSEITRGDNKNIVGERYQGFYKLNITVSVPEVPAQVYASSKVESLQVWHERFGHQDKVFVEKYLRKHNISYIKDSQFYEGCVYGKQHRLRFGTRFDADEKSGDLVQAGICGPIKGTASVSIGIYCASKMTFLNTARCIL